MSTIVIPAVRQHTATVIFSHGLGDSGASWVSLAEGWRRRQRYDEVKFIFPNAPSIPVTANMGLRMPAWYDIIGFDDLEASQDEPGILKSRSYFHSLIDSELNDGISTDRIVIGGFSQGGAMSLFSGITCPHKLGGIIGLSCYMLLHKKIENFVSEVGDVNKETKILMAHGESDPLVKPEWARSTANLLGEMGFTVDLKMYPGLQHSADPKEIEEVEKFLDERVPPIKN